jgi:predicted metal-dependent enzyme (double-stranded beta helix superfamily)
MVADFMSRARDALTEGVTEERLQKVGQMLAEASREPGFVPESEMRSLHGGDSSFTLLQSDPDGLTLMLARFSPTEETPVHNHNSWGVACVVHGQDRYRHWRLGDDGVVHVLYEKVLDPGSFVVWLDPPHDIHSQQGIGEPALELVLFGKDVSAIPRNYYDPESGDVRTALPQ